MGIRRMDRRTFLKTIGVASVSMLLSGRFTSTATAATGTNSSSMEMRPIPSSGEELPVVGVGTWQQFDVQLDPPLLGPLQSVLKNLFSAGGSVIDTSPMYGQAEEVIGHLLSENQWHNRAFLATKVWTRGRDSAIDQLQESMEKMRTRRIDLVQIHNLVDWRTHLPLLREWKQQGKIRYYGITHYTRSAFDDLKRIMENEVLDFVQLPYSIDMRNAEEDLLPLAREREIAVIVNRPFGAGRLFRSVQGVSLPPFAGEWGIKSWAQYFLKFIVGHPAVTCAVPGTSNPHHMDENARAGQGLIPDENQREQLFDYWSNQAEP